MPPAIPEISRAVLLEAYHEAIGDALAGLKIVSRPTPKPGPGQVLVRMEAAPCNPSDLLLLQGKYGVRKALPAVPGWEGAGTVVASGGGLLASWLVGKRVACGAQPDRDGTWAEYLVTSARQCIPLRSAVDFEQGASLIVNPLSALGLLETAKRDGHRAALQTAGASQLGRMLIRLAALENYPLISIVRRDEQVRLLESLGAKHVLNSAVPDFFEQLKSLAAKLGATAAFDAIAGETTGLLIRATPPRSAIYVYGGLSEAACGAIDPVELLFHEKTIRGFYLGVWIEKRGMLGILKAAWRAQRLILDGALRTEIAQRLALDEVPSGLRHYVEHMTSGKALILLGKRLG
jgi:NADPH:quinone reductase-like Zn-dependent oxidoreductase